MKRSGKPGKRTGFVNLSVLGCSFLCWQKLTLKTLFIVLMSMILLTAIAPEAQALMFEISMEELTAEADLIVVGTVKSMKSAWNDEKSNIYTTVTIKVENVINGNLEKDTINVVIPGGEVAGIAEIVFNAPVFKVGEQTLLFLNALPGQQEIAAQSQGWSYGVYGDFQGKMPVEKGKIGDVAISQLEKNPGLLNSLEVENPGQVSIITDDEVFVASSSHQFVYNGKRWPGDFPVVSYHVNAPAINNNHIQLAANTWNNAGAKFNFSYAGTHSREGKATYNQKNEIIWDKLEGNVLALSTVWSAGSNIVETDIVFNSRYKWSTDDVSKNGYYDVQTVALHELGHSLGLGHPALELSSMYYMYKGIQCDLHPIDIEGIQYIYGIAENDFGAEKQTGPFIKALQVSNNDLTPAFDPEITAYALTTNSNVNLINISADLPDDNLSIEINGNAATGGKEIAVALNEPGKETIIEIIVANEKSMAEKTYTITVNRKQVSTEPSWQHINDNSVHSMAFNNGILASSIEGQGVFLYDNNNWHKITECIAQELAYDGDILAASFEGYGVWIYSNDTWSNISTVSAQALAIDGATLVASFEEYGVWVYQAGLWSNLTPVAAQALAYDNGVMVASFEDFGLWVYESGVWSNLASVAAQALAIENGILAGSFNEYGTYIFEAGVWSMVSDLAAKVLAFDNGVLAGSFPDHGVYLYNGSWEQISTAYAEKLAFKDGLLAGSFSGHSVYLYK